MALAAVVAGRLKKRLNSRSQGRERSCGCCRRNEFRAGAANVPTRRAGRLNFFDFVTSRLLTDAVPVYMVRALSRQVVGIIIAAFAAAS